MVRALKLCQYPIPNQTLNLFHLYLCGLVISYSIFYFVPIIIHFKAQIIPFLAIRSSPKMVSVSFDMFPLFSEHNLLSEQQDIPGSFCAFLALALKPGIYLSSPHSF